MGQKKSGAGVIPFAIRRESVCFLFHRTFTGRRAGLLVDFGGGGRAGESHAQTAAREFVEETEGMFFADDPEAELMPLYQPQYQHTLQLIEKTQQLQPGWVCERRNKNANGRRNWKTFFVEVGFRDPAAMNAAWANDTAGRFKKRRELVWLPAAHLLDVLDNRPGELWKRIREYDNMREVVLAIVDASAGT